MKNSEIEKIYSEEILPKIDAVISSNIPLISNLSNVVAILNEALNKISWVGFYFAKDDNLFLGTFQGKVACTQISFNKGICGIAATERKTIIAEDVNSFEEHIACDSESKSEIVIPIFTFDKKIFGVLDIDSYEYSSFDEIDKKYLEQISDNLTKKLNIDLFFNTVRN